MPLNPIRVPNLLNRHNTNQTFPMPIFPIESSAVNGVVSGVVSLHFKAGDFFEILNDQFSFSILSATNPANSITALS